MRTHPYPMMSGLAAAAMAAAKDAGNAPSKDKGKEAPSASDVTAPESPTETPAPTAASPAPETASKRYRATAEYRGELPEGMEKQVTFIVEQVDYKSAWETARAVTRFGTANMNLNPKLKDVSVFAENGTDKFDLAPGMYTIRDVQSLQERGKKGKQITLDQLEGAIAERGIEVTDEIRELIQKLKDSPGETAATTATTSQGGAAANG